jgi:hypothetical protein
LGGDLQDARSCPMIHLNIFRRAGPMDRLAKQ